MEAAKRRREAYKARRQIEEEDDEVAAGGGMSVEEEELMRSKMGFGELAGLKMSLGESDFDGRGGERKKRRRVHKEGDGAAGATEAEEEAIAQGGWLAPEVGRRYTGTIVKWFPEKKFGFIGCQALGAGRQGHVFLSSMQLKNFALNDSVSFMLTYNRAKQTQAQDLEPA
eukprot:TRINITY_DN16799_c0_g1_i1.p1 TRINITY_DN16799_c0_g1~~TRINITY_DN16799_c0_g1_i1.p1  ORF type:complete len:199 (+),score=68.33 TRINITY_DN16799_c0_g1_i1:90-599(+)